MIPFPDLHNCRDVAHVVTQAVVDRCLQFIDGRNRRIPGNVAKDNRQPAVHDDGVSVEGPSDYFWGIVVSSGGT